MSEMKARVMYAERYDDDDDDDEDDDEGRCHTLVQHITAHAEQTRFCSVFFQGHRLLNTWHINTFKMISN